MVRRIEVPAANIKQALFSPIEYSCQNMQIQVDRIEEAMARKDMPALQPLMHGSLLVQVNEGPMKIAEVFLGHPEAYQEEFVVALRAVFRDFLSANQRAVLMHDEYVQKNPMYRNLQENLVDGLNRLASGLQVYLT
jgi:hypothetical protein